MSVPLSKAPSSEELLCPSSQPSMEGCRVLGVVQEGDTGPEVLYLDAHVAATQEVLEMAAPANPTEVFRLAATCQTKCCPHFDGAKCRLATRMVEILPAVVSALPHCLIRPECRWFRQEGAAACRRCPQIRTINFHPPETIQRVAGTSLIGRQPTVRPCG
jgi:hypothetical protein